MKKIKKLTFLFALLMICNNGYSQSTIASNIGTGAEFLGWSNNFPLNIQTAFPQPINFFTSATPRMRITGAGLVGINTPAPTQLLTVSSGNINVTNAIQNNGYMIGNIITMWRGQNGIISNIFVGANAGTSNTTGINNTFIGSNAGNLNTTGRDNTFIGFNAGLNNNPTTPTNARFNVFVGSLAGQANTTARENTFIGFSSGLSTTTGEMNTFIGNTSGLNNVTGNGNTFLGDQSGQSNTTGQGNVFIGRSAGNANLTGLNNTIVGNSANLGGAGFTNASAIGWQATVMNNSQMILGNNNVRVGIGLSGIAAGPANKLEINFSVLGTDLTPNLYAPGTGFSGLRFRDLTTASTPSPNQFATPAVLSVDANGDVILVPGGTNLGNICASSTPNPLATSWEIPLNNWNFVFSGQGVNNNNVGIGTTCSPIAKLEVTQSSTNIGSTAVLVKNNDNESIGGNFIANGPYALKGLALQQSSVTLTTTGVYGEAIYPSIKANFGVEGYSSQSSNENYGGRFQAKSSINSPLFNYGVEAEGRDAANNYGGYFVGFSPTNPTALNTGVYAYATGTPGNSTALVAEVLNTIDFAASFIGRIQINGDILGTGTNFYTSDAMFKTNIDSISNALNLIKQLSPKTFNFDTANAYGMNFPPEKQYGFIAQDVNLLLPDLVKTVTKPAKYDSIGTLIYPAVTYKSLNYNAFFAILMKGIQEQQTKMDSLSQALADVISAVNSCCSNRSMQTNNNSNSVSAIDINLKDNQSIILEQNVPNPFAEQTTINYYLPENIVKAQMLFYNAQGKLIQSVDLTEKGKGSLNVFAQDLTNGIYTYTLIADGKVIETKKMVKQK